jgi:hypothetical protein
VRALTLQPSGSVRSKLSCLDFTLQTQSEAGTRNLDVLQDDFSVGPGPNNEDGAYNIV